MNGAVWCVAGVILGADWLLHDRTPAGLRERGMIIAGTFFVAVVVHGIFETVCARWTEIEVRRGRVVLHCHGFPRRRRRREWVIELVADVVYLRYWGVRLLDARGRSLYTISEGLAADQEWVAARLRELIGRTPQELGARLTSCDDRVGRRSR
jgi:hypothetical protein